MYKDLTRFTTSDMPLARRSLACVIIITYPAAQDPEVVPPFDSHSLDVKQVPFLKRLPVPPLKERANFLRNQIINSNI